MSKFKNIQEAEACLKESMIEIREILARDLPDVNEINRTVDMWFQVHGKNRNLDLAKEILRELDLKAIDAEIFILSEKDKKKNLADTFC